jgi:hypothetical protein
MIRSMYILILTIGVFALVSCSVPKDMPDNRIISEEEAQLIALGTVHDSLNQYKVWSTSRISSAWLLGFCSKTPEASHAGCVWMSINENGNVDGVIGDPNSVFCDMTTVSSKPIETKADAVEFAKSQVLRKDSNIKWSLFAGTRIKSGWLVILIPRSMVAFGDDIIIHVCDDGEVIRIPSE